MSPVLSPPTNLEPSEDNVKWIKRQGIECNNLINDLNVRFHRDQLGKVRRTLTCSYPPLLPLATEGTAKGRYVLELLAKEFTASVRKNAPVATLLIVVATIFVLELMALDEEISDGSTLPEEIAQHPEFCSTVQAWLPQVGYWCYHGLRHAEVQRHRLHSKRILGKPLALPAKTT